MTNPVLSVSSSKCHFVLFLHTCCICLTVFLHWNVEWCAFIDAMVTKEPRQKNQSQKCCCVVRANHKRLNSGGSMLHVLALWSLDIWTWKKKSKLPCFTPKPVFRGETQSWISSRAVCMWLQNLRTDIRSCPLNGCSQTSRHLNRTKLKSDKNISCRHYVVN